MRYCIVFEIIHAIAVSKSPLSQLAGERRSLRRANSDLIRKLGERKLCFRLSMRDRSSLRRKFSEYHKSHAPAELSERTGTILECATDHFSSARWRHIAQRQCHRQSHGGSRIRVSIKCSYLLAMRLWSVWDFDRFERDRENLSVSIPCSNSY